MIRARPSLGRPHGREGEASLPGLAAPLVRISTPPGPRAFVAGVIIGERAAPIIKYMARWTLTQVQVYCSARRWRCEVLDPFSSPWSRR